jgi:hypothetical protein
MNIRSINSPTNNILPRTRENICDMKGFAVMALFSVGPVPREPESFLRLLFLLFSSSSFSPRLAHLALDQVLLVAMLGPLGFVRPAEITALSWEIIDLFVSELGTAAFR